MIYVVDSGFPKSVQIRAIVAALSQFKTEKKKKKTENIPSGVFALLIRKFSLTSKLNPAIYTQLHIRLQVQ